MRKATTDQKIMKILEFKRNETYYAKIRNRQKICEKEHG